MSGKTATDFKQEMVDQQRAAAQKVLEVIYSIPINLRRVGFPNDVDIIIEMDRRHFDELYVMLLKDTDVYSSRYTWSDREAMLRGDYLKVFGNVTLRPRGDTIGIIGG